MFKINIFPAVTTNEYQLNFKISVCVDVFTNYFNIIDILEVTAFDCYYVVTYEKTGLLKGLLTSCLLTQSSCYANDDERKLLRCQRLL